LKGLNRKAKSNKGEEEMQRSESTVTLRKGQMPSKKAIFFQGLAQRPFGVRRREGVDTDWIFK